MGIVIRVLVLAGLAIDAYVHFHLASDFRFYNNGLISGDWLFRLEALGAAVAAILLLVWANRLTYLIAFAVAAVGVAAVLLFTYLNLGKIGPLPSIYEPIWYTEKTVSLIGEAVAAVAALIGLIFVPGRSAPVPVRRLMPQR